MSERAWFPFVFKETIATQGLEAFAPSPLGFRYFILAFSGKENNKFMAGDFINKQIENFTGMCYNACIINSDNLWRWAL